MLSTRVYRGAPILEGDSGVDFVSFGGVADLISASVYEMKSIWREDESLSPITKEQKMPSSILPTTAEMDLHPSTSPRFVSSQTEGIVE